MQHAGCGAEDCSGHGAVIDGLMLGQLGDMSEWANRLEALQLKSHAVGEQASSNIAPCGVFC